MRVVLLEEFGATLRTVEREEVTMSDVAPLRLSILGPLRAQIGDEDVELGGRQQRLLLALLLARTGSVVSVSEFDGMPGVGKTTIAVHLAHRLADSYPDGQLYIDLRGFAAQAEPMTALEALHSLLSSLGERAADQPDELNAAAGLFRSVTTGRRILVVLDKSRAYRAPKRSIYCAQPSENLRRSRVNLRRHLRARCGR